MSQILGLVLLFAIFCLFGWGTVESTSFSIRSCPLSSSRSFLSIIGNRHCSSSRKRSLRYGLRHTYVQIGNQCYDWGGWNYPRRMSCNDPDIACCAHINRLEYSGRTNCANNVYRFESAWTNQHRRYHVFNWNCQKYSDSLKEYLQSCNINDVSAF